MKLLKIALLLLSFHCFAANADIYDELADAIRAGDAHHIAGFFDAKVNLALSNQEDVYSKAQAELLIKDFFSKNPGKTFNLVHKGSSREGSLFAEGGTQIAAFTWGRNRNKNRARIARPLPTDSLRGVPPLAIE